jgi:3-dehydroquinate synthase
VQRGCIGQVGEYVPSRTHRIFVVTTRDVWALHGEKLAQSFGTRPFHVVYFTGGESRKRMAEVETMAEEMVAHGGDRSSIVVAFGGGIVTDLGGFLAAIFMRGIPVIQVPTTLLAQVDAAVGGKTGANLVGGKNLIGAFHQPRVVLIDPSVLATLPEREYRAGLQEILKAGVIRSLPLFELMEQRSAEILALQPDVVDEIIAESVGIKCEVVTADEKEGDLRRILNYTVGHALEAETGYQHFLHGEAVAIGMRAANRLSVLCETLSEADCARIDALIARFGPYPSLAGIAPRNLLGRLGSDKKAIAGKVHFVLAQGIGDTKIVSGLDEALILRAIEAALA